MAKEKITLYIDHIIYADGIFTWMINFAQLFNKEYNVEILTKVIRPELKDILENVASVVEYKDGYVTTDYYIMMLDFVLPLKNVKAKKKYKMIHCNYEIIKSEFTDLNDGSEFIAVSKQAADGFTKRFGFPCKDISSFVAPYEPRKMLRIVSCSRVYNNKGFERMFHLADDLDELGVRFQWINYSQIDQNGVNYLKSKNHGLVTFLPNLEHNRLMDAMADAHYVVQLSDKEGYCYAVHEALMLGTPVIVTDIEAFKDVVKDGYNGYKIPLDMSYDDKLLNKIIHERPTGFEYKDDMDVIHKKWKECFK